MARRAERLLERPSASPSTSPRSMKLVRKENDGIELGEIADGGKLEVTRLRNAIFQFCI